MSDRIPSTWDGSKRWNGKRNPVMLVNTVLARKTAVQISNRFEANNPNTTTNPEKIPIKLNTTCTKVNVVIPKIMLAILPFYHSFPRRARREVLDAVPRRHPSKVAVRKQFRYLAATAFRVSELRASASFCEAS